MNDGIQRRTFIRTAALATGGLWLGSVAAAHSFTGNVSVEEALFVGVNRAKDPAQKTPLEKKHVPVIEVPALVKAGEPFAVTVSVGEILHPMGAAHYIDYVELLAGNEPAGRMEFRSAFSQPKATFFIVFNKPVTLVARIYCNLHGLWQSERELAVG